MAYSVRGKSFRQTRQRQINVRKLVRVCGRRNVRTRAMMKITQV